MYIFHELGNLSWDHKSNLNPFENLLDLVRRFLTKKREESYILAHYLWPKHHQFNCISLREYSLKSVKFHVRVICNLWPKHRLILHYLYVCYI